MRLDPAVAAVRSAVRRMLQDAGPELGERPGRVLVAVSGGADSLALAAATAHVARRLGWAAGAVTVDHRLQPGSAQRAHAVAERCRQLGLSPVFVETVTVGTAGGPEAAARDARYRAFGAALDRTGSSSLLLGHTLDDQAETVLLGLARGSGARALAGMAARTGRWWRPLLLLRRQQVRAAALAEGLQPWDDPHNLDRRYARSRVRLDVLPALEAALGPGIAEALARTAAQLRDDADALDAWTAAMLASTAPDPTGSASRPPEPAIEPPAIEPPVVEPPAVEPSAVEPPAVDPPAVEPPAIEVAVLAALPRAVRSRMLRRLAVAAGVPAGQLSAAHLAAVEQLITGWRGQRGVSLPAGFTAERRCDRLTFR